MKQLVTKSNLDAVNDQLAEIQAKEKELLEQQAQLTKAYAEQKELALEIGYHVIKSTGITSMDEFERWFTKKTKPQQPAPKVKQPLGKVYTPLAQQPVPQPNGKNIGYVEASLVEITRWLHRYQKSKNQLSLMMGKSNSYVHQAYTYVKKYQSGSNRKTLASIIKLVDSILDYINEYENPQKIIEAYALRQTQFKFIVSIFRPELEFVQYYIEQTQMTTDNYLELNYSINQYDAKLLDYHAAKNFVHTFHEEHPNIPVNIHVVSPSEYELRTH